MVMERYEVLSVIGEGTYGQVMKCRHRESGQIVAIKKFIRTEEGRYPRTLALREIRILKLLRHENVVSLIEVFRKKKRFHLVFEFMSHTLLEEIEEQPSGIGEEKTRSHLYQLIRGIDFCHENHIVHRDLKPDNVLISEHGVLKVCDFGFARFVSPGNEPYTDYVATRWYRAPELLIFEAKYGRSIDIWAIGCILMEMLTGDPLFPGSSDLDQMDRIVRLLGSPGERLRDIAIKNKYLVLQVSSCGDFDSIFDTEEADGYEALKNAYPKINKNSLIIASECLRLDPNERATSTQLLEHKYFHWDRFATKFMAEFDKLVALDNSLMMKASHTSETGKGVVRPRKPSFGPVPDWKFGFDSIQNPHRFSNVQTVKKNDSPEKVDLMVPSSFIRERTCVPLQLEGFEKLSMPLKKDIMPRTQMVRPVNGHLVIDQNFTLPCNRHLPRRYVCEDDFTLPNIPGANGVKKKRQESKANQPIHGGTSAEDMCECLLQSLNSLPAVNSTNENSKLDDSLFR